MRQPRYEVIAVGEAPSAGDHALRGREIFYKCTKCDTIVATAPKDSGGCRCGNIFVDVDAFRIDVDDISSLVVLRKVDAEQTGL